MDDNCMHVYHVKFDILHNWTIVFSRKQSPRIWIWIAKAVM